MAINNSNHCGYRTPRRLRPSGRACKKAIRSALLQLWQDLIEHWGGSDNPLDGRGDIGQWRQGGRWLPFMTPDQDTLNITVMVWPGSITTLGPDVMGFASLGEIPHAIGTNKPWRRNYISKALRAKPPRYADNVFWSYADKPAEAFARQHITAKRLRLRIASMINRVYR